MSLDWNLEEIQGNKELCWIDAENDKVRMNPVTETLIFATISTGIGKITEENWSEFYTRLKVFEKLEGPFLVKGDGSDWWIEPSDVENHIGLSTNVGFKDKSRSAWCREQLSITLDSLKKSAIRVTADK